MSLLLPLWLWAAVGLAIPIVIHLLSRGRGRVVPVGTIRFLPPARSRVLRRLRPTGLLRFLLRAALIASLAFALAAPRWWRPLTAAPGESWVLVDPSLLDARDRLEDVAPELYQRLDTLAGSRGFLLSPGLPTWSSGSVSNSDATLSEIDLWSLVSEATARVPASTDLEVFVLDRADSLRGARPDLGRRFEWWTISDPDPNRWIQRVVARPADTPPSADTASPGATDFRATIGTSTASGTRFETRAVPSGGDDPLIADPTAAGGVSLRLVDGGSDARDDQTLVPAGLEPLRARLRHEPEAEEAEALRLALTAVADYQGRDVVASEGGEVQGEATERPGTTDLFVEVGRDGAPSSATDIRLSILGEPGEPCRQSVYLPELPDPWVEIHRCGESGDGVAIWRDAWGRPLLSTTTAGPDSPAPTTRWHGRLDPSWSSLSSAGLPHLLLSLIAPGDAELHGATLDRSDRRAAVEGESRPLASEGEAPARPDPLPERLAWAFAALLFLVDRFLVGRSS